MKFLNYKNLSFFAFVLSGCLLCGMESYASEIGPGIGLGLVPSQSESMQAYDSQLFTYEDMEHDIQLLKRQYPDLIEVDTMGETFDGRSLYHLRIGRDDAANHILIFASIHGREYITTQMLMQQTDQFIKKLTAAEGQYNDTSYETLMNDTAIHVVPMINPDGVTISQKGLSGIRKETTLQKIYEISGLDGATELDTYLRLWKANAEGVDINRNFDALWGNYDDHLGRPSADHYKGEAPGCTPESRALINLTERYNFKRTISYHTQGEVIYWYFAQQGELKDITKRFADEISKVTGYPLDAAYENIDPAGYKDWAIMNRQIPSLTIEVGKGTAPLDVGQLDSICEKNKDVWAATLYTLNH